MTKQRRYFTYILSNRNRRLYVGMTNDLNRRLKEHRIGKKGFAAAYRMTQLVYFEIFPGPFQAMRRESEIKKWRREKKIALIESVNPHWEDLEIGDGSGISPPQLAGSKSHQSNFETEVK
ncbi:MAG: GIY-YIG nuclease family protein [Candidatus Marinimicrobia bacterium]|nr:GIY-YIG nuclease family protein [Candidatus Neomarinimicrobiota bacterium]MCF7850440.1 GIY-YIG nuclease family protein [Candidatus Neomarinimicrobiota bacterium]MCF7904572.1 GIY-YIG nuclease family protein [Candidatus Neomarinimicrobiota bacterium]